MKQKQIEQIVERGIITEGEIRAIRMQLRKQYLLPMEKYLDTYPLYAPGVVIRLTPEQNEKGYKWLMNQWKTPTGKIRKNNPFRQREQSILRHFDHFEFWMISGPCNGFAVSYVVKDDRGREFKYEYNARTRKKIFIYS